MNKIINLKGETICMCGDKFLEAFEEAWDNLNAEEKDKLFSQVPSTCTYDDWANEKPIVVLDMDCLEKIAKEIL